MPEEYVGRKFDTVFISGGRLDASVLEEFLRVGRMLNGLGYTPENAGNFSVRWNTGMLITVGGVNKGVMGAGDVVEVVDFDFECAKVVGGKEPSSEAPMHWLIYHSFPQVKAIIHVHDDLVLGKAERLSEVFGIHSTERESSYGTEDQAYQVVDALEHSQYAIIHNHGIVCMGETLAECVDLISRVHDCLVKGIV